MKKLILAIVLVVVSFAPVRAHAGWIDACRPFEELEPEYQAARIGLIKRRVVVELNVPRPDARLTRAEFTAFLLRSLGWTYRFKDIDTRSLNFSDVTNNHWARPYIFLAASEGIVRGNGQGKFEPDRYITLHEVKIMLGRALRVNPSQEPSLALRQAGVDTVVPCGITDKATVPQMYILVDRALAVTVGTRLQTLLPPCADAVDSIVPEQPDRDADGNKVGDELERMMHRAEEFQCFRVFVTMSQSYDRDQLPNLARQIGPFMEHTSEWTTPFRLEATLTKKQALALAQIDWVKYVGLEKSAQ